MEQQIEIQIALKEGAVLPFYASEGASGCDVRAFLPANVTILPQESAIIPTGLSVSIPPGFEIQVRPRSGLAAKNQMTVLNTPGTIDSDYRGEICVILMNHGKQPFVVEPGMRIAQFVVTPVFRAKFIQQSSLASTCRGEGRFGHTGTH